MLLYKTMTLHCSSSWPIEFKSVFTKQSSLNYQEISENITKPACDITNELIYHVLLKKLERQVRNTNNSTVTELSELLESICTALEQFCALGKPASSGIAEHTTGVLDSEQVMVNS